VALTFTQLAELADDPVVRGRVRVAATRVAVTVAAEPVGDANWVKRRALAQILLDQEPSRGDGSQVLDRFVWGVIGQMPLDSPPTDVQLQAIVADVWDALAGVSTS
jgi:hypothetical protein